MELHHECSIGVFLAWCIHHAKNRLCATVPHFQCAKRRVPQAHNVSNRRWSGRMAHAEPAGERITRPALQGLNKMPHSAPAGLVWVLPIPPVPLALHRRLLTSHTCGVGRKMQKIPRHPVGMARSVEKNVWKSRHPVGMPPCRGRIPTGCGGGGVPFFYRARHPHGMPSMPSLCPSVVLCASSVLLCVTN